jgi:hypothetical protein
VLSVAVRLGCEPIPLLRLVELYMNSLIYLVGLIVVVLLILSFFGLR